MTSTSSDIPPFPIHHAVRVVTLATLVPMAIVAGALALMNDFETLSTGVLVGLSCLVAALGALEPVRIASLKARSSDKVTLAALMAIVVRLGLTILLVVLVVRLARLEVSAAGLWAMGWYVLLLIVEVRVFQQYFKTLIRPDRHDGDRTKSEEDSSQTDRETEPC